MMIVFPISALSRRKQAQDFLGALAIEVARGLVGHDERGIGDEGTRDRHALLLAARQLVGIVLHAIGEAHECQRRLDTLAALAPSRGT